MLKGIGIDLLKISRIGRLIGNERFMKRVYTEGERQRILRRGDATAAGIFCAKEAFLKAVGVGLFDIKLTDIEVCWDSVGRPVLKLHGSALERYPDMASSVSITHDAGMAAAAVALCY